MFRIFLTAFFEISLNSLLCLVEDKQFISTLILCNTFYPVFLSCISLDLKCIPDFDMVSGQKDFSNNWKFLVERGTKAL